jgi:hypothetical protein
MFSYVFATALAPKKGAIAIIINIKALYHLGYIEYDSEKK